jgi:hypothetical protein
MARSDTIRSETAGLEKKGSGLERDVAKARKASSDATAAAQRKQDQAARTRSDATRRSVLPAAERELKKGAEA